MPPVIPVRPRGRRLLAAAAAVAAATVTAVAAPAAHAAPVNPEGCVVEHALTNPFIAWDDAADYALAPAGDFEADGWQLSGGAAVVDGNQPFDIGAPGVNSLALPPGAVATSAPMCIDETYPHFRLFARGASRRGTSRPALKAEVLFLDDTGAVQARDASSFRPESGWAPSPNLAIDVPWTVGEAAPVQFRFTAVSGAAQIDDVYVDPYGRG